MIEPGDLPLEKERNMKKFFVCCFLLLVLISFAGCSKDEITKLEDRIAELEQKLEVLKIENSMLKSEKNAIQSELDELKTEYDKLKEELNLISFKVSVYDIDGESLGEETFKVSNDANFFDTMKTEFDVDYSVSDYGVYLNSINGSIVDSNYYLAIYENGAMASTGVDGLVIDDNDEFEFKVECWNTIESGYGVLDQYDVLVDKIIYSYAKNYMPEILTAINDFNGSGYWDILYVNMMMNNGYDANLFNNSYFSEELKNSLNVDLSTLSGASFGKYYYTAKVLGNDLTSFKEVYQNALNNDLGAYSEWVSPLMTTPAKSLDITSSTLESHLSADYKADLTWGPDGRSYQVCNLALFNKCDEAMLEDLIGTIEFGNAASNSLMLMAFASLGLNPRDSKYEVNQKDILENLIDVYYDENLGLVKYAVSDTGVNFSTSQIYAGLMAYKASRDLYKAVNIFE